MLQHARIREIVVSKVNAYKPLLVPSRMQAVMVGLQIVEQMRRFTHDDAVVGILGFLGGPPHMRAVARDAVTTECHFCGRNVRGPTPSFWLPIHKDSAPP